MSYVVRIETSDLVPSIYTEGSFLGFPLRSCKSPPGFRFVTNLNFNGHKIRYETTAVGSGRVSFLLINSHKANIFN